MQLLIRSLLFIHIFAKSVRLKSSTPARIPVLNQNKIASNNA